MADDINVGQMSEALNDKADRNLLNTTTDSGFRRLVEISDVSLMPSWYKVYEEYNPTTGKLVGKWCEQGGQITKTTSSTLYSVTLLKTYKDTLYCVQVTDAWNSTQKLSGFTNIKQKTSSSFNVALQNVSSTYGASWLTNGYIS